MAPLFFSKHSTLVTINSAFTPALTVMDGKTPHLGLILADIILSQVLPGDPSVQAINKLVILTTSPQL